jgi:hypothetical protein
LAIANQAVHPNFSLATHTNIVYTTAMLKNITFSADEALIREARRQAALQNTTLNELFRQWLERYVTRQDAVQQYQQLVERLGPRFVRKYTREEMNERR